MRQDLKTSKGWIVVAWLVLGMFALMASVPIGAGAQAPTVDPEAVRILKRMTEHLAGLPQFSFVPPKGSQKIEFMPLDNVGGSNR